MGVRLFRRTRGVGIQSVELAFVSEGPQTKRGNNKTRQRRALGFAETFVSGGREEGVLTQRPCQERNAQILVGLRVIATSYRHMVRRQSRVKITLAVRRL